MQPPPRTGPPGATGPPPSGPNMFRRTRPYKHTAAATATMPPATQPMTDPFAFVRAPPPMAAGGLPTIQSSNPPPMQAPPNTMYSQAGGGLPPQPQTLEDVPAAPYGPPPSSVPGVTLFNPHSTASPVVFPVPSPAGYASSHTEQGYFNSREQTPSTATEPPPVFSAPAPTQTQFNQDFQGQPTPQPVPFQPVPPTTSSSHWAPDHGSRPPSVQNYFQPTSDPPPQPFNIPPQPQMYPSHAPSPHQSTPTPPPQPFNIPPQPQMFPSHAPSPHQHTPTPPSQPVHPHIQAPLPPQNLVRPPSSQWPDPNAPQQHNSHFQSPSYFSPQDSWFNQPTQDSGYHQMGTGSGHSQPTLDSGGSQHVASFEPGPSSAPPPVPYSQESGTLSMFFKDNDVENEETLAGDRNKAVNGIPASFQYHNNPQTQSGHTDAPMDYQGASLQDHSHVPYMNDGSHASQRPPDSHYDHVENLECVPNQEVLPSETHGSPAATAVLDVDQFETGPNLETPDSVPRPMRSASVSSNYSNMSHGSGTGTRRHQGVVGTFIQQESPRLTDDASLTAATGGYFEQIDTSPAGDMGARQSSLEQMWQPTPSPPKPTGIFQASANSSFEPVRSHGVGVRPAEVDMAKIVAEGGADSTPGNLEQPPDNMENIYGPGHPLPPGTGVGVPHPTHPVVLSHSRPSSRAYGASRPCESPATTLWAQHDPASLGANILLAPAAPMVLAPLREPSADVIQPPEDGPLNLQPSHRVQPTSQQHSENLENPPKVSDAESPDSQGNMGYASLLVADSLHQPVLIAPPVSNYSVISPSTPTHAASQSSLRETTPPVRSLAQGQGASTPQSLLVASNPNPLFAPGPVIFNSSASNQGPLNLTRDNTEAATSEITAPPQSQPVRPPLSRGQPDNHSALQVNAQASLMTPPVSNHNPPSNYELLDFSMHQSQTQNQASGHPSSLHESPQSSNGFYLQVTKDAQQGVRIEGNAPIQTPASSSTPQVPPAPSQAAANTEPPPIEPLRTSDPQPVLQGQADAPRVPLSGAQPFRGQYPAPAQGPAAGSAPPPAAAYPPGPLGPGPPGASHPASAEPPRPPSAAGSQQGYGPPPPQPGQMYSGYYGYHGEYPDSRAPYPPGQYPPPPGDPRAPPGDPRAPPGDPRAQQYYQDGQYRTPADPWYGRYDAQTQAYRDPNQYREPQPERPSSRASQYSDRPSSRQGYPEDYQRANRSAYSEYYADYPKNYDYRGYNYGQYDPRYRGYYDQAYWANYDENYRARENYYNQQVYPARKEGVEDQWRYYPGYDPSFDDDYQRRGEIYGDEFDRRSVHSEQSAHSVHSSQSHHSRRSSFSSRSQQSQVYRSQPDLVSAVYDTTASTLAVDYSYAQYPNQTDATQNYSQYLYPSEYTADSTWISPEQLAPPRPATPEKFSIPHRCARFGPGGHLVQVLPNLPSAGQPALVDIHNMETMLQDTPDQAELRAFPGPLVKEETHKVDVIKFSQNKAMECSRDNNLLDRDSACLLWDFIMLLCRQNGTVVGTDIADLLLKEHRSVWLPGKSPNEANLIDFNNEPLARAEEEPGAGPLSLLSDTFMIVPENVGKETERFRELLLFGRKKDALEAAMKGGLWGHALLLASKMDNRTHARVMTRFANSLPINDPLQTVYQLMSGRMPASATCCGEEKWGDWRPHLAMVLSNLTHTMDLDTRTITTMGDTLASKGLIDAAHFCYMMAQVSLGVFTKKSTKMVLIGSNHSFPFYQFATNEAIQRTEAYEYAQSLGSQPCTLHNFQVFKLIYACRLAEAGLSAQAFHYCEVISKTVLMQPAYFSPVFISQIIQMSEKLRFFDPQLKEKPEQELFNEPDWLIHLRQLDGQIRTGVITYSADRTTPLQFDCSSPSDLDQPSPPEPYSMPLEVDGPTPDNPLMSSLLPGPPPQGVQLMPPAPTSILQEGMAPPQPLPPGDVPYFYPVPPSGPPGQMSVPGYPPQDPGFAPPPFQPQPEQTEMYPVAHQQPFHPPPQVGQMSPHMLPQVPHSPVQMNHPLPQMPQHMHSSPGHMPPVEHPYQPLPEMQTAQAIPSSPTRNSFTPKMDFYDHMAHMGPGRSRTTSQSSMHMVSGRRSRTTSESSTHSGGRERSNSAVKQISLPPPSIPEQPRKEEAKKVKKDPPKQSGGGGVGLLKRWFGMGKNEAHLPDDKNPSIVWDEQKQKWVDLNEPEEERKPPPPPPSGFPKMAPMAGPAGPPSSGGPPVNMFSRKAGTRSRYVDVLNPSRTAKPSGLAPAPADIFAPLAPMAMPANLFVPSSAPDDQQPLEGSEGGYQEQNSPNTSTAPQMFNPTLLPPAPEGAPVPDGSQSGELSRSSSMSSLSREVSQHLNQSHPPQGAAPTGGITFYNPAQFAQPSAAPGGGVRPGRLTGQRQYPVMK
ncbi:protein transport protein Sec16A isoform X1 [Hippoglossus hippoglossus]|uniref:protein transport protein Sec16A isoform X1 n=1 Tax=Hippoglossus hippoglossus TaxID=8267 RepID=UPI00148B6012|nr:protein transport protein Sec16A isoform X1 [Hippoglossus hippoglossus]XP_034459127.1 protein transport protein Sec16A isoform X1 [Hippoglossus hippoglossus]